MTIAIYPGSFDPFTYGHLDILRDSAKLFDKVIIAVGYNSEKNGLIPVEDRVQLIRDCINVFDNVDIFQHTLIFITFCIRQSVVFEIINADVDDDKLTFPADRKQIRRIYFLKTVVNI